MATISQVHIFARGQENYLDSFAAMRAYTDARDSLSADQLWLVEHPPVYTLGMGADRTHILNAHEIPVVQTDRGGEVTYHGPGQAIVYLLMDLRRQRKNGQLFAREFVYAIEAAVIDVLFEYGIEGIRRDGAPGIYIAKGVEKGAKISALGLKIRSNGCTYHGVSLNVKMDLRPFSWINPCGYQGMKTIDMHSLGVYNSVSEVHCRLTYHLLEHLRAKAL